MNCAMLATARRASRRSLGARPVPADPALVVETVSMGGSCVAPRLCGAAFRAARQAWGRPGGQQMVVVVVVVRWAV
jgi:hypothetical protein